MASFSVPESTGSFGMSLSTFGDKPIRGDPLDSRYCNVCDMEMFSVIPSKWWYISPISSLFSTTTSTSAVFNGTFHQQSSAFCINIFQIVYNKLHERVQQPTAAYSLPVASLPNGRAREREGGMIYLLIYWWIDWFVFDALFD